MGCSPFRVSSACTCTLGKVCKCGALTPTPSTTPNPNPFRFRVGRCQEWDYHLVAEVIYPDCTTFEGRKILVLSGVSIDEIRSWTKLDPHFTEKGRLIARFRPDQWDLACWFVGSLYG